MGSERIWRGMKLSTSLVAIGLLLGAGAAHSEMVFGVNETANLIMKFDLDTGDYKGSASFLSGDIYDMDQGPDGLLYCLVSGNVIRKIDPYSGEYKGDIGTGFFTGASSLSVGPDGVVYVATNTGVFRFEPNGTYKGIFGGGFINPGFFSTMAVGLDNTAYVVNEQSDMIMKFDAATGQYKGNLASGFSGTGILWSLAVTPDDTLYVRQYNTNPGTTIFRFDATDGTYKGSLGTGFLQNTSQLSSAGLVVSADGTLVVNTPMSSGATLLGFSLMKFGASDGKYDGYVGFGFVNGYGLAIEQPATISGKITLQGCPVIPSGYIATLYVYKAGTTTLLETVVADLAPNGDYTAKVFSRGNVDIYAKPTLCLSKKVVVDIPAGGLTNVNVLQCLSGDADGDDYIGTDDYIILNSSFDKSKGDSGYDGRADFACDDYIGTDDYLLLNANFDVNGARP